MLPLNFVTDDFKLVPPHSDPKGKGSDHLARNPVVVIKTENGYFI